MGKWILLKIVRNSIPRKYPYLFPHPFFSTSKYKGRSEWVVLKAHVPEATARGDLQHRLISEFPQVGPENSEAATCPDLGHSNPFSQQSNLHNCKA